VLTMTQVSILRLPSVELTIGLRKSAIYDRIDRGLFPAPVDLGPRSVGWVSTEVEAIQQAIIRGASEDELRQLVSELHQARGYVPSEKKRAKYKAIVAKRRSKAAPGAQAA
jgi:prophage regulatory protein